MSQSFNYLELPYNEYPEDTTIVIDGIASQIELVIKQETVLATQTELNIVDRKQAVATQIQGKIVNQLNSLPSQTTFQIKDNLAIGAQCETYIIRGTPLATQIEGRIIDIKKSLASQTTFVIKSSAVLGTQILSKIVDRKQSLSSQVEGKIIGTQNAKGFETNIGTLVHSISGVYCVDAEDVGVYCADRSLVLLPTQINFVIKQEQSTATQILGKIVDKTNSTATQILGKIIDRRQGLATQIQAMIPVATGTQIRVAIYNTTNLRILREFPSRGTTGTNWTASNTASGDFSINNVNSDIIEQYWRTETGVKTAQLTCDTELPQGVFNDTFAILGHNFSRGVSLVLYASNTSNFSSIGFQVNLEYNTENIYYISPDLPITSYRYWRIEISDAGNADNFLKIGTIVFGSAIIFQGECFVDSLQYGKVNYTDGVQTEGFTFVKNDRAMKKYLNLSFKQLNYNKGNYENLAETFDYARTTLKCLWIPTPDYPERYAVFAKITDLPHEEHNNKGRDLTYVDLDISLDESK